MSARALRLLAALALCCIAALASAQDSALAQDHSEKDDRGFIVGLLEDALGGEGRIVRVEGFEGVLSQNARIARLSIADRAGIWLTLEDVDLKWTRTALLRGRIEVQELSAAALTLARPPLAPEGTLPSAEASGFALPNLPVSVSIDLLKLDRITLGRDLLGETLELRLQAQARLANGSGSITLNAARSDAKQGQFVIAASYDAATQMAAIDIDLSEPDGGIAARLLNLPRRPDLSLQVSGAGHIDDLVTDISLATGGIERIEGQVTLRGNAEAGRAFDLDINGDLTPLLATEYHGFFGPNAALRASGRQSPDGAFALSALDLRTRALALQGSLALESDLSPRRMALSGQIAPNDATEVILPIKGAKTRIAGAALQIGYDAALSDIIEATFDFRDLRMPQAALRAGQVTLRGTLASALGSTPSFNADVRFAATGAEFDDAALQEAAGDHFEGRFALSYLPSRQLRLDDLALSGAHYGLMGAIVVQGLEQAFAAEIDVTARVDQLSPFAKISGTQLAGRAEAAITGTADLGGAFDLRLAGSTSQLQLGIDQADRLLAGVTRLDLRAVRDAAGTRLPRATLQNTQFSASGSARLRTAASDVTFDLTLPDSAGIDPRLSGPIALTGRAAQDGEGWQLDAQSRGPFAASTRLKGRVTGAAPALDVDLELPDISPLAPQFRGPAKLTGSARSLSGLWQVQTQITAPYGITGALEGTATGPAPNLRYRLRIPDVATLGAQIEGPLSLEGSAAQSGANWRIETAVSGLSGATAQLQGLLLDGGRVDLSASGALPLALLNPFIQPRSLQGRAGFDLSMRGRPALSALSGTLRSQGARLSVPNLRIALDDIAAQIALERGRAQIEARGALSSGGRIGLSGPVLLNGALNADLAITLEDLRLVDPALYSTQLDGQLSLRGPLSGGARVAGQITLGETNIRVPESQSAGFTIVPQIVHRGAPAGVRRTLSRAGLEQQTSAQSTGSGPDYPLDITINAPARIFVRGRGLDAELGGALALSGTSNRMISTGQFSLIRGRVDILTKRFDLTEGSIALQGSFDPFLRFMARTNTEAGSASITIEGPASEPRVSFSSTPEAPQDEVLAQIFFGRDVSKLSAFQALQLASAVATLAGKGGEGIVTKLRRGFGLDDLDVTSDADGTTGLRLGKYLSENVYTDVTIDTNNSAGVSINIDLSKSLTARGQVTSDGNSSVGIFFEKDY